MNFKDGFQYYIKILCLNKKNNEWISKVCYIERGIRQGCTISSMIFLFVKEILSIKIMSDEEIKGFKTPIMSIDIKMIQHTDAVALILRNEKSLKTVLTCIKNFGFIAGFAININKTECILLGNLKDMYNELHGVQINNDCTKS